MTTMELFERAAAATESGGLLGAGHIHRDVVFTMLSRQQSQNIRILYTDDGQNWKNAATYVVQVETLL
jgi:hypothetical protein